MLMSDVDRTFCAELDTGEVEMHCEESRVSASDPAASDTTTTDDNAAVEQPVQEMVEFTIIYNKQKYEVKFPLDESVDALKNHIEKLTDVPAAMQKIMFKGRMNDDATLRINKVTNGSKIMVVGSTINDVLAVTEPALKPQKQNDKVDSVSSKEPFCKQKVHKTVLDKYGKPDDVPVGLVGRREQLPPQPLSGMYNKSGSKVRLTFKTELNQVWIGTKERTEKVSLGSIKTVVSEPIEGHQEYHIMAFQLGPTEASRYWVYWVPAQYVEAIKDAVLGNWQFF